MFVFFARRFNLIDSKETEVLRDLEIALRLTDDPTAPAPCSEQSTSSSSAITTTTTSTPCSITAADHSHQHPHNNNNHSPTTSSHNSSAGSCADTTSAVIPSTTATTFTMSAHIIDGDINVQPICTQPESGSQPPTVALTHKAQHASADHHDTQS